MPVFSYIAYPICGKKNILLKEIKAIKNCYAFPSESHKGEVIIIVTETSTDEEENDLKKRLNNLASLQSVNMVFGCNNI